MEVVAASGFSPPGDPGDMVSSSALPGANRARDPRVPGYTHAVDPPDGRRGDQSRHLGGPRASIRSLMAAIIGGVATFVFLLIWDVTDFTSPMTAYVLAGVVSAVGTLLWPAVLGVWAWNRAKSRRDDRIQEEVNRQLSQKG